MNIASAPGFLSYQFETEILLSKKWLKGLDIPLIGGSGNARIDRPAASASIGVIGVIVLRARGTPSVNCRRQ
jgi:hypothetical protein